MWCVFQSVACEAVEDLAGRASYFATRRKWLTATILMLGGAALIAAIVLVLIYW